MLLMGGYACQSPEDFVPSDAQKGINGLTAYFINDNRDENSFSSEINYEKKEITVVFPYNYPRLSENVLTTSDIKQVRVVASLDNNATITPSLLEMDLSKENLINVKDSYGNTTAYKLKGEIRKSAECSITDYTLPSQGLTGIINEEAKTITMISIGNIGKAIAKVSYSHGATLSPDPTVTELNYDQDQQVTVTAQNGITKSVYTIKKGIPGKIAAGLRAGSAKLLWTKKLVDIGAQKVLHMTTGIATMGDYLLLNERGQGQAVYLDAKTGEVAGSVNISSIAGGLINFYATADDAGHALFCNLSPNAGAFTIWRVNDVNSTPVKYIELPGSPAMGRKMSVIGNIDTDAIITVPYGATAGQFARWQVKGGKLVSNTPDLVIAGGLSNWGNNADVIYTDPTDIRSIYAAAYYATPRSVGLFNGATNERMASGPELSPNWTQNAVDVIEFNKVKYMISNSVNSFTWGTDDSLYMYDISGNNLDNRPIDFSAAGLNINGLYGAKALGSVNANGTGDVAFRVSNDGFYLYIYFMFTNGYVGCVQVDCIDM